MRIGDPHCFPCTPVSRDEWLNLRDLIVELNTTYDYTDSPEFKSLIDGKSESFVNLATKLAAEKRADHVDRLNEALANALDSGSAFDLISKNYHDRLRTALDLIR